LITNFIATNDFTITDNKGKVWTITENSEIIAEPLGYDIEKNRLARFAIFPPDGKERFCFKADLDGRIWNNANKMCDQTSTAYDPEIFVKYSFQTKICTSEFESNEFLASISDTDVVSITPLVVNNAIQYHILYKSYD
jgi:hypothetical protein